MRKVFLFAVFVSLLFASCTKGIDIIEDSNTLSRINLSIAEKYLWSNDSGLYVIGANGISLGCNDIVANYNQKWEFPARIEYLKKGNLQYDEKVGFRIKGNCSRGNPMKSFGIYWRSEYGNKKLHYSMFSNNGSSTFKRLFLRNSGNDFGETHIRDAVITMLIKDSLNVDIQDYKPSVLYLNGEYWGIYNIREMITKHYFENHYGVDSDEVNLLEGYEKYPFADDGSADGFLIEVIDFVEENDMSDMEFYYTICERIEIESYMDYIIANTYVGKTDWPGGNAKWWQDPTSVEYFKWRWVVYDGDWGFKDIDNVDKIWIGDLYGEPLNSYQEKGLFLFNKLIENEEFKSAFLERYLYVLENVFEKERVKSLINELKRNIEEEYPIHQKKWNVLTEKAWEKEINKMIEYNDKRNELMKGIIKDLLHEG